MVMTLRAIYTGGVLKPLEPLSLPDNQVVYLELVAPPHRSLCQPVTSQRCMAFGKAWRTS